MMEEMLRFFLAALLAALPVSAAEQSQREVAQWVIRQGGFVRIDGRLDPIKNLKDVPAGEVRILGINLVGTVIDPKDLKRFSGLTSLRELELPGPIWNPGAGSK